jgi:DNA-binding transcriptional LysR family regulator
MDTLRAMRYFVRMVELGSMSAVSREEGTTQPNVSKVLRALEAELGTRLIERSTTSLHPTDQGMRFYRRAKGVLDEFREALDEARGLTERPAGLLRINAPVAFGQLRLNAIVGRFLAAWPEIEVELILEDRYVDLVEDGVDLALRLGRRLPPDAIARRIAASQRRLYAAPAYLAGRGAPVTPQDLAQHECIRFAWTADGGMLHLERGAESVDVQARGRYRINNAMAIRDAMLAGGGIGLCPEWLVDDLLAAGRLLPVLGEWSAGAQELFLLYPSRRYQPLRARLFADLLAREVQALPGFS